MDGNCYPSGSAVGAFANAQFLAISNETRIPSHQAYEHRHFFALVAMPLLCARAKTIKTSSSRKAARVLPINEMA